MSVYSIDSLEDTNEITLRNYDSSRDDNDSFNLVSIMHSTNGPRDAPLRLKSTATPNYLSRKQDTGSNKTSSEIDTTEDLGTIRKNTIIANNKFSEKQVQLRRCSAMKNKKRDVADRMRSNSVSSLKQEEEVSGLCKKMASGCRRPSLKLSLSKQSWPGEASTSMKPDKKLSNVLVPRIQQARKPRSYLEHYRRRFSEPRYNARSPEGSTLSVFGDSQQEQLTDEDTCLPSTSRDDRSELSFYRRLIEGFSDCTVATARSSGTLHQHVSEDTNRCRSQATSKADPISNKSKSLGYKPYTIEEYQTLPIPNLDRSLGPDKVEMQAKREWLMRRRSYGNSVSAHNRQRIALQAQKLEPMRAAPRKCFLPPLKDKEADVKTQGDSISSTIFEDRHAISQNGGTNCSKYSKRDVDVGEISSSRKSKKFGRAACFGLPLNSRDIIEDSYLESLRQRHLYEKKMVDRIISQAVCP
ncbi:uncharacterized protein LOC117224691 [Megalopta genalis]|uniref:uncharacterized protein LOC117224691 n=1 Tax=Megalopta genalis TaxID=115081 RepID=UPI003FD16229